MKKGKVEKNPEEIAYSKSKTIFGTKCLSILKTRGVKALEYQLEFLKDNDARIYQGLEKTDAIDIINSKIYDFKQLSSMMG